MTGVINLSDVQSTESETSGSDSDSSGGDYDALESAVEAVGGDFEHAKLYVEQTNNDADTLIDFAAELDDELMELHERYRQSSDVKRIDLNWLRNDDERSYSAWRSAFYGDSDDPEPGTHNAIAQEVRGRDDGNLFWYRAIFPEPQTDYWDDDAVVWHEYDDIGYDDGEKDSHIYVTREFAEEYADFTIEVDGDVRPRPPADSEIGDAGSNASGSSDLPVDPSDFTVEELRDAVQEGMGSWSESDFEAVLEAEENGKDRKTARKAITGAMNEADFEDTADQSELSDYDSEKVEKLVDAGFSRDEVLEMLS